MGLLGRCWDHLLPSWGSLVSSLCYLGAPMWPCWPILGPPWLIFGPSWGYLGRSCAILGLFWGSVQPSWRHQGFSWGQVWLSWGLFSSIFGFVWTMLGHAVAILGFLDPLEAKPGNLDENCDRNTRPRQLHDRIDLVGGPVMRRRRLSIRPPKGPC